MTPDSPQPAEGQGAHSAPDGSDVLDAPGLLDESDQISEFLDMVNAPGLSTRLGIEFTEITHERVVGTMPVAGNTQPYGILHGGAHAALAETLGSVGAALHAGPNRFPVGIELSCSHHRSVSEGLVTGTATPISSGRTLSVWEIVMTDESGRRLSTARLSCLLRDR